MNDISNMEKLYLSKLNLLNDFRFDGENNYFINIKRLDLSKLVLLNNLILNFGYNLIINID